MKPDMHDLIAKLRRIGFEIWDPLDLAEARVKGEPMADEYDRYLQSAFSAAANNDDFAAICAVLREAEILMGLENGGPADSRERAARDILGLARQPNDGPARN
jgi:hypothetical protein